MDQVFIDNKIYNKADFSTIPFKKGEYESCKFINCDLSNADFSHTIFIECEFDNCNLSLVKLIGTIFRDTTFKGCKMMGLQFHNCNEYGLAVSFDNCTLNHSSFFQRKMKKIIFRNTQLKEVDFTECDLTSSVFDSCNLLNAKFESTIIEKADFRTSINYSINPEMNRIKKAKFSLTGVAGLLDKYDIQIDP